MPAIVGLTGGIASGKSTVSSMLRELGVTVIDADLIAREIVEPGEAAYDDIVDAFGTGILDADGRLDRAALGAVIFEDPTARATLNAITHPRIGQRMMEYARQAAEDGASWVVYDAALLVENGLQDAFHALIVVAADEATQIARLRARDGLSEAEARARIDAQMPLAEKVAVADHVIDNCGSLSETRAQVEAVARELQAEFEGG